MEIAEARKDVIAFASPYPTNGFNQTNTNYLSDILDFRLNGDSTSYGVADSGYKLQYDNFNDEYVYIPMNADIAGTCVRTDLNNDAWYSPAGLNRGGINRVVKLPFNPNQAQRDDLYKVGINPVVSFPTTGPVLFGDKTLLSRPSAFDRINVRRLFIILEKSIATAAKYQLFEFNDEFTRAQFVNLVTPFLRNVQGRRGITDFRVVCNETNNTPQVIDSNNFVADIYIKPNKSINFIQLNFIATPSGLSFEEVVGA
jgi:phage tail sheath protein FI